MLVMMILQPALVQAQRFDSYHINQRLGQIEQQLLYMQQQISQSGYNNQSGQLLAEIGRIDEEIRMLRGQIEQTQYQIDQLHKRINTMQEDIEYRLQELGSTSAAHTENIHNTTAGDDGITSDLRAIVGNSSTAGEYKQNSTASDNYNKTNVQHQLRLPADKLDTPRSLYNHAFKLLNQTNYAAAEQYFKQFTQQYPDDPLVGNAWYWLGESYYVRRDYVRAADSFRQGFEILPDGPKAGDNLLKLAMALAALKRNDEACVVLRQVEKKYANNSSSLRAKSKQEINRLGCS